MTDTATAPAERTAEEKAAFLAAIKAFEGQHDVSGVVGPDAVSAAMIRHWAEAMGDTNPVYTDPEAAAQTHFGDIVAPAAMLQVWIMRGMETVTPVDTPTGRLYKMFTDNGMISVVATNCEQEYVRPLRIGEVVEYDQLIETVSEEKTTGLGVGHFVTTLTNIYVRHEDRERELVGTHRFRILRFRAHDKKPKAEEKKRPLRPRAVINRDNQAFWDGVNEHKLLIQRCTSCETLRFPFSPGCNECASLDWDTVEASGRGEVYSHVTMHYPKFEAFDMPYAVGLVELEEGVRIVTNIVGIPHDQVRIGMPVELEFVEHDDELTVPAFRPTEVQGA